MVAEPCFSFLYYWSHLRAAYFLVIIIGAFVFCSLFMDQSGMLNIPVLDQDSLDDDVDLVVFDNRLHSQSSTRRHSLSPSKRGRIEDHYPPGNEDVAVDPAIFPKPIAIPPVSSTSSDWKAELGSVLQNEVLPHVFESVNQQLQHMNSQFVTSASQAACLFESLQNAMTVLNDQQHVLRQTTVDSVSNFNQQQAELLRLRTAQESNASLIQHDQQRLQEVSQVASQQAQAVRELHFNVEEGFSRTANVLSQHEDRFRTSSKNPASCPEAASSDWWPHSNVAVSMDPRLGLDSVMESPIHFPRPIPENDGFFCLLNPLSFLPMSRLVPLKTNR